MKNAYGAFLCALTFTAFATPATSQSVLERTPNLAGGWVGQPGTLHFHFLHRFTTSGRPERQVLNSPTFFLAYAPVARTLIAASYATRSDIAPRFPNEWELLARYSPLKPVSLQIAYNNAAESIDGEASITHDVDRLRLLAAGRVLSNGYASDTTRFAVAGGVVIRLTRWLGVAGDVVSLLDRRDHEDMAWGAAVQIVIPYTPHTLSLQAANTSTATLQGASRGGDRTRYGFEFTVPVTLGRWFGRQPAAAGDAAAAQTGVVVSMKNLKFSPNSITIRAGTTVTWRNDDPLAHTVTAQDGSWTSPMIEPGGTYVHAFAQAGRYEVTCTPHPFMKSVVEVKP